MRPDRGITAIEHPALIILRNVSLNGSSGGCLSCASLLISNSASEQFTCVCLCVDLKQKWVEAGVDCAIKLFLNRKKNIYWDISLTKTKVLVFLKLPNKNELGDPTRYKNEKISSGG